MRHSGVLLVPHAWHILGSEQTGKALKVVISGAIAGLGSDEVALRSAFLFRGCVEQEVTDKVGEDGRVLRGLLRRLSSDVLQQYRIR